MFRSRGDYHQGYRTHVCALHAVHCLLYYALRVFFVHYSTIVGTNDFVLTIVGRCGICVHVYECLKLMQTVDSVKRSAHKCVRGP
jgi:hypothetical protein